MSKILYLLLRLALCAVHTLASWAEQRAARRASQAKELAEKANEVATDEITKPGGGLLVIARAQIALARAAERSDAAESLQASREATCARLERWRANVRHFGGSTTWTLLGIASEAAGLALAYLHTGAVREVVEMISERWGG